MDNFTNSLIENMNSMVPEMLESLSEIIGKFLPIILILVLIEIAIFIFKYLAGESEREIKAAFMEDYDFDSDSNEIDWDELEGIADNYFFYDFETGEYIENDEEEDD